MTQPNWTSMKQAHWLLRVTARSGIVSDADPGIEPRLPTPEAWNAVSTAFGISQDDLAQMVADYFRLDRANLERADPRAVDAVPESLCRKHVVFPVVASDRQVTVATCNPTDVTAEREIGFTSGRSVVFQVASPREIKDAIDNQFSAQERLDAVLAGLGEEAARALETIEDLESDDVDASDAYETPTIKLTTLVITEGIQAGASDIHLEPGRTNGIVRLRVDGVLRQHMELPMVALKKIISRIKILAKLDIADRLRPQDGKARVQLKNSPLTYDLRISTIPAGGAEKCVIRILDSNRSFTLDDLGLPDLELERFRQLLSYRDGIVLVTGPTGSGKTTTLYGALTELATGEVNIMTVEDPIEYELGTVTQTQVETKQGMTFAKALRALLRQDPDVILVGEIRDAETAEVAAQAAMTGHLVLATVHANDSVSAVARLADLGLSYSTIPNTLRGALAQRLLRRVCPNCAEPVRGELTPEEERLVNRHEIEPKVRAVGCTECGYTGYKGRLPVQEVMIVTPRLQSAIEARKGPVTLQHLAVQGGMRTMHTVALDWVQEGKTTLDEVERVLGQDLDRTETEVDTGPSKILIVDDDEDARVMMRSALEKQGYEILEAQDGQEALDIIQADPDFSLMILDLAMPRLDGRAVLAEIRKSKDTAALPVLVRTGTVPMSEDADLLEAGADDFVTKDMDSRRFLARVRAVLRRSSL